MTGKKNLLLAAVATLALGLYGCGGSSGPQTGGVPMTPEDVDLSSMTAGFMAGAGTVQVAAGQSVVHGDIEFSCAAGGADCTVMVMVGANGDITVTSTGGMVTAMNAPGYPPPVQQPVQCPDGTTVPAGETCPVQQPTTGSIPWLLPGTTESAAARNATTTAITTIQNSIYNRGAHYYIGKDHITGRQSRLCGDLVDCNPYDEYLDYWGYWTHPAMSSAITKVQQVYVDNPDIPHEQPTESRVMGLMQNGYFGIAYSPTHDQGPNDPPLPSEYQAFYVMNDHSERAIGEYGDLRTLSLDGASWSGDAFGFSISSETPVFGPATLTLTGEPNEDDRRSGWQYAMRFNVDWTNGDRINLSGNAGGFSFVALRYDNGIEQGATHFVQGHFAGSRAEEAFGRFHTPEYIGSFGASRE